MSVCLIIPPSAFLLDERVFISLGILRVATALETAGIAVDLLDLSGVPRFEQAVIDYAHAHSTMIYGITATTPQMPCVTRILRALRANAPRGARLILGGPHATLLDTAARKEERRGCAHRGTRALSDLLGNWDQLVIGDGEAAIRRIVVNGDTTKIIDMPTATNFRPARHLVDLDSYHYTIDDAPATSLISQLGCPFACNFCSSMRRVRRYPVTDVLSEIHDLHAHWGYRGFMFYDDELNVNPELLALLTGLAQLQGQLGVDFRLRGFLKAELTTEAQLQAMYAAGFRWVLIGFESGSSRILTNIDKKATVDDNTRAVDLAHAAGLKVKALMSIGHAGESEQTCAATATWLEKVRPDDFDITIITPYPGSAYHDDAVETQPGIWTYTHSGTGDRLHSMALDYNETADYYKGSPGSYTAHVYTDHLSAVDLLKLRETMEQDLRQKLGTPWNPRAATWYEYAGRLTPHILRRSP